MASRRMDREMNGSRIRSTPTSNKTSRDDDRGYPRSWDSYQKQAASNSRTSRLMEEISRGFPHSGDSYQKQAASNASSTRNTKTSNDRDDNRGYPRSGDIYQKQAASTKNKPSLGGISNLYNANDSTGRMKRDIKNGVTPKANSDNRGYPRSGDSYQKQAARNAPVIKTQAASNAKKPSDERNDTRGYARSGDSYQKQAARNAPVIKTSERDDSRGYHRSGDSSQKQAAKNSSPKPSILNLEKAMNDYAAGKLNVKKVTSKPTTTKKPTYAFSVINDAFNRAKRMADNQRGNNFKVIDTGMSYDKSKKKTNKKKR